MKEPCAREDGATLRGWNWWRTLLTTFVLFVVGIFLLIFTGNANLFPTIVLLGTFAVPVAFVVFIYERQHLSRLGAPTVALTFLYGGLLGVFAASLLEPLFVHPGTRGSLDLTTAFVVGLIEEFAKILGVWWMARRLCHDSELDGIILGAAAGMGFAALESMGYAFTAFVLSQGSLSDTVALMLLRGILSPVGHGTWTAILAGVLFRESAPGRFRLTGGVLGAYVTVVVLHGLWDGLPTFIAGIVPSGVDIFLGQAVVGLTSLFILWWRWREAVRLATGQATREDDGGSG